MNRYTLPLKTVAGLNARWRADEIAALRECYVTHDGPVRIQGLADRLGRNKANVCRKARSLGLTNQHRRKVEQRKPQNKYASIEEARAAIGAAMRRRLQTKGHPRGAAGMEHSEKTKSQLSARSLAAWADPNSKLNSPELAQRRSDHMIQRIVSGAMRSGYTRTAGGRREDLGNVYFRSSWEANYARYLNFLVSKGEIAGWGYEVKTFAFEKIKRGTRAYTPDFKVTRNDGGHEWHEVKGWMDAKSKTRLARFARYFPHEKLVLVDEKWFTAASKTLRPLIPGWETKKAKSKRGEFRVEVTIEPGS